MTTSCDAAVIGAGPAGAAAATVLAEAGWDVLLLEKERAPRRKVCGELLAGSARDSLARLSVLERVEALGPERIAAGTIFPPRAPGVPFRLPSVALGVSRRRLDALLVDRAVEAGARLESGARVVAIDGDAAAGFRLRLAADAGGREVAARAVVGAWGRWDALDKELGRRFLERRRFFGFARDFRPRGAELAGDVRVYLYPGGYCGLSRVEGGRVHLAGLISERARRGISGDWEAVVARAFRANAALARDLATLSPEPEGFAGAVPLVFAAKRATLRGMLLAGDASGFLDAFAGEGQAGALASGILAADHAARFLAGDAAPDELAASYARAWRERFAMRFRIGGLLRRLVLSPRAADAAARLAGPALARLAIRGLKRGAEVRT